MADKKPETVVARCADCAYVQELGPPPGPVEVGAPPALRCQRYPKLMTIATGLDPNGNAGLMAGASFPPCLPDEWCGEFEPMPASSELEPAE